MPTDTFPEINIAVVTIVWLYTGLNAPEMAELVTPTATASAISRPKR